MFSVVIPVFNCENTITAVLESVVGQTRIDLIKEIIIVNDGSTDSTGEVIQNFINVHEMPKIIYIQQDNQGASAARNKAIRLACGEWIALLDGDDLWDCSKIERQYELISKNPDMVFLGSHVPLKFWWKKHSGLYKLSAKELCVRSMPTTPSVVFKKEAGLQHGLFREDMHYCEDIQFFQKFLLDDSYYVLAEELVEISFAKKYFAQSGLSSRLYEMHKGRNRNVRELRKMGLITDRYMYFMLAINEFKFIRRYILQKIEKVLRGE